MQKAQVLWPSLKKGELRLVIFLNTLWDRARRPCWMFKGRYQNFWTHPHLLQLGNSEETGK